MYEKHHAHGITARYIPSLSYHKNSALRDTLVEDFTPRKERYGNVDMERNVIAFMQSAVPSC